MHSFKGFATLKFITSMETRVGEVKRKIKHIFSKKGQLNRRISYPICQQTNFNMIILCPMCMTLVFLRVKFDSFLELIADQSFLILQCRCTVKQEEP